VIPGRAGDSLVVRGELTSPDLPMPFDLVELQSAIDASTSERFAL